MTDTTEATPDVANLTATDADDVAGIKSKNFDLVGRIQERDTELASLRKFKKAAEDAKLKAAGDFDTLKQQLETSHQEQLDKLNGELRTIKLDNALKAALTAHNINPEFMEAAEALLLRKATFEEGVALIDGKAVDQAVKTFAGSKMGSKMVLAPDSTGGESPGSDAEARSTEAYDATQYSIDRKVDPVRADAKARRTGNEHLIPPVRA